MEDLKTAATLHGEFEGAIEQTGIKQVPLEVQFATLDRSRAPGAWRFRFSQAQGKRLGGATGFDEFVEGRLDCVESSSCEALLQVGAGLVNNDAPANINRVASKADGIGFTDGDSFIGGHALLDETVRVSVEGLRIINQPAVLE